MMNFRTQPGPTSAIRRPSVARGGGFVARLLAGVTLAVWSAGCRAIHQPRGVDPIEVEVTTTAYCPCGLCCGWERTWWGRAVHSYGPRQGQTKHVGLTASGVLARPGTLAADTTVFPFGTVVYIEGYGFGRVEDRGSAIRGHHFDLYFPSHQEALNWGRRRLVVKVWPPDRFVFQDRALRSTEYADYRVRR